MTLSKLSLRNARRQAGDYLVYFVTILLVAALTYAFNGLVFSQEVRGLSQSLASIPLVIVFASIVMVCILSWLVSYTTRFMLLRRSREFGTYVLIGLENKQVARLFFLENLVVGGCALVLGILLGNLLYQALRALVLALFGVPYYFSFFFSPGAVGLTLLYFVVIYLTAQLKSRRKIRKMRIYDLIYFERQNEGEVIKTGKGRRRIFTVSVLLGIAGTALLLMRDMVLGLVGAFLMIVFLYGFFLSFASGVPAFFEKRPSRKYRGQRLLVFRTLTAKLGSMGVVMATVALLFMGTLMAEGTGMTFRGLFWGRVNKNSCFDLILATEDTEAESYRACLDYVREHIPQKDARKYDVYLLETSLIADYTKNETMYFTYHGRDSVMRESDYMALRAMLGYPAVELASGQYMIHCLPYVADLLEGFSEEMSVGGMTLAPGEIHTEVFAQHMFGLGNGADCILVVPDEAVEGQKASHTMHVFMTTEPVSEQQYRELQALQEEALWDGDTYVDENTTLYVKSADEASAASLTAMTVFPLYYLALVLTMTAATILTVQQLGEAGHYRKQFELLRKLGMEPREMHRALGTQLAIYYALPVIPPVLVGGVFIFNLANAVEPGTMTGASHPLAVAGTSLGLFFLIYGIYILMAYSSMRRNVLPVDGMYDVRDFQV